VNYDFETASAVETAKAVQSRNVSASSVVESALDRIADADTVLNCFTAVTRERALAEADRIDKAVSCGETVGPLAGVPFAVKNLLDIKGLPTLAGSVLRAKAAAAGADATSVTALCRAGAVLVGALNMDEFAYGFTTENSHYGPTRNPHDVTRVAGGSSGGSAAAVAAGLVPVTLGSDTNGSIRVPSSFCGIFGLKPTYGRVSRAGAFLFVASLDHIGPFARSVEDLATVFDALQGFDPSDPVCTNRPPELCYPELSKGAEGLRVAVAGEYFASQGEPEVFEAVSAVARGLNASRVIEIPAAATARAAAFVITASEGGNHHLADLRTKAELFDPLVRSRLLAGALTPAAWVSFAQRFRAWFRSRMVEVFQDVDVILAPATPSSALKIGQKTMWLDGKEVAARPNIGIFTQPISFVGLPVVTVPAHVAGRMPVGVQLIGAPYSEAKLLRTARELEIKGVVAAPVARGFLIPSSDNFATRQRP
jgi:aspartyl-tRNA(Asn)/glutamyl-tRNA(Gln) amidotransferase subunit A